MIKVKQIGTILEGKGGSTAMVITPKMRVSAALKMIGTAIRHPLSGQLIVARGDRIEVIPQHRTAAAAQATHRNA